MEVKKGRVSTYYLAQGYAEPGEIRCVLRLAGGSGEPYIERKGRYTGGERVTRIMHTRVRKRYREHATLYTLTNPDHARALFAHLRQE